MKKQSPIKKLGFLGGYKRITRIFNFFNKHTFLQLFVIVLLTVCAYVNIFQNEFAFDDPAFITGWKDIQSFDNFPFLLKGGVPLGHGGLYRPLRSVFYTLSYRAWGENPFGYHLQSLLIILSLTLLVYLITSHISNSKTTGAIAALFFGVHPIHTESITFMTASFDSIGVIFFFLSFYLYIVYRKNSLRILYLLSLLSATIAFFTYEITLTLPLLLFLYDILFIREKPKIRFGSIGLFLSKYIPYLIIAGFYFYIRIIYLQIISRGDYLLGNPFITFLVQVQAINKYIQLLFYPIDLTINHLIAPGIVALSWAEISKKALLAQSLFSIEVLSSLLLIMSLFVATLICFKKYPWISFSILWFFITLSPVLNIIPQGAIMTERYLLIPSFGFCLLAAMIVRNFYKLKTLNINNKFLLTILLVVVLGLFYNQTIVRNSEWKTSLSLWQSAYNLNPNSYINTTNLAVAYGLSNSSRQALELFKKAVIIAPDNFRTYQNLGVHYFKMKKYSLAIDNYYNAIKFQPNLSYLYTALSVAYLENKNYDMAVATSKVAVQAGEESDPNAYFHLGEAYVKQKKYNLAIDAYQKALKIDPDKSAVHYSLGYLYYELQKYQLAIEEYQKSLINNPKSAEIYFNLGKSLEGVGRPDLALKEYQKAIDFNPKFADSHNNIGIIYTGYRQMDKAEMEFKQAILINPKLSEAYFNLAYIYKQQGKIDLAKDQLEKGLHIDPTNNKAQKILD